MELDDNKQWQDKWHQLSSICLMVGPFDTEEEAEFTFNHLEAIAGLHVKIASVTTEKDSDAHYVEAYRCGDSSESSSWVANCSVMSQNFRKVFS